ncbi:hypothetical protein [Streptomyces xanthochromogenes]|uniref:hypothetical protein n=1 Tax=Streptomyces xanthochromogenes TaxID=67384 RepID=UPI001675CEF1|nr:hypothetical protein [Streptomyces xanthochromogenes]
MSEARALEDAPLRRRDPREAQITWLEAAITQLREQPTQSEQTVEELTDFCGQAVARLAAQHEEVVRLREATAEESKVRRLPTP